MAGRLRPGCLAELNEDDCDDGKGDAEPTAGTHFLFPQDNTGYGQQADLTGGKGFNPAFQEVSLVRGSEAATYNINASSFPNDLAILNALTLA